MLRQTDVANSVRQHTRSHVVHLLSGGLLSLLRWIHSVVECEIMSKKVDARKPIEPRREEGENAIDLRGLSSLRAGSMYCIRRI